MCLLNGTVFSEKTTCIRFKLEITLANDEILSGEYIFYGMYTDFDDTSSFDEVLRRIKYNHEVSDPDQKLTIYKNVGKFSVPLNEPFSLLYCLKEDVVEISLKQIKSYKVIDKVGCHPETESYKYQGGCPPEIITELTQKEIKMLTNKPKVAFTTPSEYEMVFGNFSMTRVLSYGELDSLRIMNLIDNFLKKNNLSEPYEAEMTDLQYNELKAILKEKNIVIFRTYYYN